MSNTGLSVSEDGFLIYHVLEPCIYSIPILKLSGNEFHLNHGRFQAFGFKTQMYQVLLANTRHDAKTRIDWIAENTVSPWSLKIISTNAGTDVNFSFSFADGVEAAFFALRWR